MKPHIPVLLKEAVYGLQVAPGKRFIDATYGGGGHSREIKRLGGEVLGIDADPAVEAIHGNFKDIEHIAKEHGFTKVDGILFDLGVSSHQLDTPERGFSYRFAGPLDMRLSAKGATAEKFLRSISEEELYEILAKYGEVERARVFAKVVKSQKPKTTEELLQIVGKDNASQVFQAIRIAVNDELGALKKGLIGAKELLKPGGRLVVISFHSLEDRIVKNFMRTEGWKVLTKKPISPSAGEIFENKRARSAKLRIAEKL